MIQLAVEAGLRKEEVRAMLSRNDFADNVRADIDEARRIGVQGVPFFVFNKKYAVSGAQPSELFLEVLHTVNKKPQLSVP